MRAPSSGQAAFAVTLIAFGAADLIRGRFGPLSAPVPAMMTGSTTLMYLCAVIPLTSGVGFLWPRFRVQASGLLLAYFFSWLLLRVSLAVLAPSVGTTWAAGRTAVVVAATWVLWIRFGGNRRLGFPSDKQALAVAQALFGLAQIPFGFAHFLYLDRTASLVPAWLPEPALWASFTGVTFLAAGLGVLLGVCARLAAVLTIVQTGLFVLLVWIPIVAGNPSAMDWRETVVSVALTVAGWVVAESYRGTPWLGLGRFSPRASASGRLVALGIAVSLEAWAAACRTDLTLSHSGMAQAGAVVSLRWWSQGSVENWQPRNISSPMFESHAAFDPWTGDLYFVRSTPAFEGWRLLVSHCDRTGWSEPVPPPFAGDGVEADPVFSANGRSLYFISSRSTDGIRRADLDLWQVDRDASGRWGTPVRLPAPLNSDRQEWFPRFDPNGVLYFGSGREGGLGRTDIWRARPGAGATWHVENLGAAINTPDDEYEALPTPDGAGLVLATASGYYYSARRDGGWAPRVRLGPDINVNGTEIGASFSPTGRSLLMARDTRGPESGEFMVWRSLPAEAWPPACPASANSNPDR